MLRLLAVAASLAAASGLACSNFTLAPSGVSGQPDYNVCWSIAGVGDAREITLHVEAHSPAACTQGHCWVGFGLSETAGAQMAGSDIIVVNDGKVQDLYAVSNGEPQVDGCEGDDWTVAAFEEDGGWTRAVLRRAWVVKDKVYDRDFHDGRMQLVLALGTSEEFGYHASYRRAAAIDFVPRPGFQLQATEDIEGAVVVPVAIPFDAAAAGATGTTEYVHGYLDVATVLPDFSTTTYDLVQLTLKDDTIGHPSGARLHHAVLKSCKAPPGTPEALKIMETELRPRHEGADGDGADCPIFSAVGPGNPNMVVGHDMGMRVKETTAGWQMRYLWFEYHMDNPRNAAFTSTPMLNLTFTSKLRAREGKMVVLGDAAIMMGRLGQVITPGEHTFQVDCRKECTKDWAEATLYQVLLHMHQSGTHARLVQKRNGEVVRTIVDRQFYNFDTQPMVVLNEPVTVLPGDELSVLCKYHNQGQGDLEFGDASSDEMCMAFVLASDAVSDVCGGTAFVGQHMTICASDKFLSVQTAQDWNQLTSGELVRTFGAPGAACSAGTPLPPLPVPTSGPNTTDSSAGRAASRGLHLALMAAVLVHTM
eukprot:TRINITY_DN2220_c1_g2_i1.p1 TRINITY_DN2220_c1_g2~~TRINITY_DN2220_c1_g2_i1.p1  ORF type:complete len:591 (+),score=167.62 TRINITY_DN2220_c1_g2_i1:63-1835(+)